MDRLTATIKLPEEGVFISCSEKQLEEIKQADKVSPREIYRMLQSYEDTGLTPNEINAMKAEYSDTFQSHLNQMLDIKDKRIAELETENKRLKSIMGKEKECNQVK